jgi:hypothetical protein
MGANLNWPFCVSPYSDLSPLDPMAATTVSSFRINPACCQPHLE